QRIAQLVAQHGQELVLGTAGFLELAEQPLALRRGSFEALQRQKLLRDVAGEAARVAQLAVLEAAVGMDQDVLDRPVLAAQARGRNVRSACWRRETSDSSALAFCCQIATRRLASAESATSARASLGHTWSCALHTCRNARSCSEVGKSDDG